MLIKTLLHVATMAVATSGLAFDVFGAFKANPALSKITSDECSVTEKFKVRMDVGQDDKSPRMLLDGLSVELLREEAPKGSRMGLPGIDGPHPQTSTGALKLNVLSDPHFIDIFGTQKVRVDHESSVWELVFRKDASCGTIICGFNVPAGAKRNEANLPPGRIYVSFNAWDPEKLAVRQVERFEAEARAKEYMKERDDELQKYAETPNLFKKAMHYRNAAAAVEKLDLSGIRWLSQIPLDSEVVPIGNGLLVNTKGQIWQKDSGFFGAKHTLLGNAVLSPLIEEKDEDILRP